MKDAKLVNGEYYVSERGVVLMAYFAWKDEGTAQGKRFMEEYCALLWKRGYGMSAYLNFLEIAMIEDKREGMAWVKSTFAHLVKNDITCIARRLWAA